MLAGVRHVRATMEKHSSAIVDSMVQSSFRVLLPVDCLLQYSS